MKIEEYTLTQRTIVASDDVYYIHIGNIDVKIYTYITNA